MDPRIASLARTHAPREAVRVNFQRLEARPRSLVHHGGVDLRGRHELLPEDALEVRDRRAALKVGRRERGRLPRAG
jgi:hypothetical protein